MLATAHGSTRYNKSALYQNHWFDNHGNGNDRVLWLNCSRIQTIPEETDAIDCLQRTRSDSEDSTSSTEDCYVVLEVQRPLPVPETNETEKQLKFAEIIIDDQHRIEYDQIVQSIATETPTIQHAEQKIATTHVSNYILCHTPRLYYKTIPVFHNHSIGTLKLRAKSRILTYDDLMRSSTLSKQSLLINHDSIESLDSIEECSPKTTRTTTFAALSSERRLGSMRTQPPKQPLEIRTLPRRFTFDYKYLEKCSRMKKEKLPSLEVNNEGNVVPFYLNPRADSKKTSSFHLKDEHPQTKLIEPSFNNKIVRPSSKLPPLSDESISSRPIVSKLLHNEEVSAHSSLRKRLFNRFQNLLKPNATEKVRSWQHKTIFELFGDRKSKTDRQ